MYESEQLVQDVLFFKINWLLGNGKTNMNGQ